MSFQGLVFLQASGEIRFSTSGPILDLFRLTVSKKISILNTIYEYFTGIGVNELRNMTWNKRARPMNIRRLGSAKM